MWTWDEMKAALKAPFSRRDHGSEESRRNHLRARVAKSKRWAERYFDQYGDKDSDGLFEQRLHHFFTNKLVKEILNSFQMSQLEHPTPIRNRNKECFIISTLQLCLACPPMWAFIKINFEGRDDEGQTVVQGLDDKMKALLAKCLIAYPFTYCTSILGVFPQYAPRKPHDAEEFFRTLHEQYFGKEMPLPKESRRWTCPECEETEETGPEDAWLQLPANSEDFPHLDSCMEAFKIYKEGIEMENRRCSFCNKEGKGHVKTIYQFSNVFSIYARSDNRVAKLEEFIDLSTLEPTEKSSCWRLAGVVFYRQERTEDDSHYVAMVKHNEEFFLLNDHLFESLGATADFDELAQFHGLPHYAVYYRLDWKERMESVKP